MFLHCRNIIASLPALLLGDTLGLDDDYDMDDDDLPAIADATANNAAASQVPHFLDVQMDSEVHNQTAHLKRDNEAIQEKKKPHISMPDLELVETQNNDSAIVPIPKTRRKTDGEERQLYAATLAEYNALPVEQEDDIFMEGRKGVWEQEDEDADNDEFSFGDRFLRNKDSGDDLNGAESFEDL